VDAEAKDDVTFTANVYSPPGVSARAGTVREAFVDMTSHSIHHHANTRSPPSGSILDEASNVKGELTATRRESPPEIRAIGSLASTVTWTSA
jgi:hypothetical protein